MSTSDNPTNPASEVEDENARWAAAERAFIIAATRFHIGRLCMTPGAKAAFDALPPGSVSADGLITRHLCGDWGDDMDEEDRAANDRAIRNGERILSAYTLPEGTRIWIITEADQSSTTLLLPDEY